MAGPEAAMPAIVSTIQVMTTVRLWERTQRVSDDTSYLRFGNQFTKPV